MRQLVNLERAYLPWLSAYYHPMYKSNGVTFYGYTPIFPAKTIEEMVEKALAFMEKMPKGRRKPLEIYAILSRDNGQGDDPEPMSLANLVVVTKRQDLIERMVAAGVSIETEDLSEDRDPDHNWDSDSDDEDGKSDGEETD